MKRIINFGSNMVEVDRILAMSVNSSNTSGPTNQIKITFKTRKEYIYNPNLDNYEMEVFNDELFGEYFQLRFHCLLCRNRYKSFLLVKQSIFQFQFLHNVCKK